MVFRPEQRWIPALRLGQSFDPRRRAVNTATYCVPQYKAVISLSETTRKLKTGAALVLHEVLHRPTEIEQSKAPEAYGHRPAAEAASAINKRD